MRLLLVIVLLFATELGDSIWSSMSVTGLPLEIFQLGFNIHRRASGRFEQKESGKEGRRRRNEYISGLNRKEEKKKLS